MLIILYVEYKTKEQYFWLKWRTCLVILLFSLFFFSSNFNTGDGARNKGVNCCIIKIGANIDLNRVCKYILSTTELFYLMTNSKGNEWVFWLSSQLFKCVGLPRFRCLGNSSRNLYIWGSIFNLYQFSFYLFASWFLFNFQSSKWNLVLVLVQKNFYWITLRSGHFFFRIFLS